MTDMEQEEELLDTQAWNFCSSNHQKSPKLRCFHAQRIGIGGRLCHIAALHQEIKESISDVSTDASLSRHSLSEAEPGQGASSA